MLGVSALLLIAGNAAGLSAAQEAVKPVDPLPSSVPLSSIPTVPDALKKPEVTRQDPAALPSAKFMPEGTFVTDREGKLIVADSGDVILVPSPSSDLPLMVVLPCQRLEQMLASRAANGPESSFLLSGQVFVYRGREFLLPTLFSISRSTPSSVAPTKPTTNPAPASPATTSPTPTPTPTPPGTTPSAESADPRVSDLIRDLEASRNTQKRIMPTTGQSQPNSSVPLIPVDAGGGAGTTPATGGGGGNAPEAQKPLANEGTVLVSRRGRVIRLASEGGRLALAVDNDPNSPSVAPMILQPSRMMEQLESVAGGSGEELVLRVSGRVMVFEGKNYLLPTFYQFVPKMDITPRQ